MGENNPNKVSTNAGSTKGTATSTSLPLTFGNFATQNCGAWSMLLLNAQNDIAKTGAQIAQNFTEQQAISYKGQATLLKSALDQSFSSADNQAAQMRQEAYGNFMSAGTTLAVGVAPMAWKGAMNSNNPTLGKLNSTVAGRLDNLSNKLAQQEKMLNLAHKGQDAALSAPISKNQTTNSLSPEQKIIENRKLELAGTDPLRSRTLDDPSKAVPGLNNRGKVTEETLFPQKDFASKEGHYYFKKNSDKNIAAFQEEQFSKGTRTEGAYYFKELDDRAIGAMSPAERKTFIEKVDREIKMTKTELNTAQSEMQQFQQVLNQTANMLTEGGKGYYTFQQSICAAEAKKDEAQASNSNQQSQMASSITQALAQARAAILDNVEKGMQGFAGAFSAMARG